MKEAQDNVKGRPTPITKGTVTTTPIRVKKSTSKKIKAVVQKLNRKTLGKRVRVDDVLEKALSLLNESHFSELKNASLSNADRLEMKFREYCKKNGPITKDEYLGLLMAVPKPQGDAA